MIHRLDFDLELHRLAAAADGGGSGDYKGERCLEGGSPGGMSYAEQTGDTQSRILDGSGVWR